MARKRSDQERSAESPKQPTRKRTSSADSKEPKARKPRASSTRSKKSKDAHPAGDAVSAQDDAGGASASRQPTREMIELRAYEISQSDQAGTDEENWVRAERELLSELE